MCIDLQHSSYLYTDIERVKCVKCNVMFALDAKSRKKWHYTQLTVTARFEMLPAEQNEYKCQKHLGIIIVRCL